MGGGRRAEEGPGEAACQSSLALQGSFIPAGLQGAGGLGPENLLEKSCGVEEDGQAPEEAGGSLQQSREHQPPALAECCLLWGASPTGRPGSPQHGVYRQTL